VRSDEFRALDDGDVVRHAGTVVGDGQTYIVTGNYGNHVILTRTLSASNPDEWDLIAKAEQMRVTREPSRHKVTHPEGEYAYQRRLKEIRESRGQDT
jgi:hypothetical protein